MERKAISSDVIEKQGEVPEGVLPPLLRSKILKAYRTSCWLLCHSPLWFVETESLTEPGVHPFTRPAGQQAPGFASFYPPTSTEGSGDAKSGLHACTASALPTEHLPAPVSICSWPNGIVAF